MAEYGHTGPTCTSNIYYITWLHFRRISGTVASNFSGLVAKGRRKLRIAVVGNVGRNDRISLSGQDLRDRASPATGFPYRPAQTHMWQQSLGDPAWHRNLWRPGYDPNSEPSDVPASGSTTFPLAS